MRLLAGLLAGLTIGLCVAAVHAAGPPPGAAPMAAEAASTVSAIHTSHAFALHGAPKYGPDVAHFDYVNPGAPKGGTVRIDAPGTFDSFNGFTVRGVTHLGFQQIFMQDGLMIASGDEPATFYGLIAETISYPEDYAWVEFKLRDFARWHDGAPITAEDVVFSYEMFKKPTAHPNVASTIEDVALAEIIAPDRVRFTFKRPGSRAPITDVAVMPVIPKHYWETRDISSPTVEPPLGSGPYRISKFELGRSITYERVPDYWAKDLPMNVGRWNYDVLRYDFYRDPAIALEAFKSGQIDIRWETSQKEWAIGYKWPAAQRGLVQKTSLKVNGGVLLQGFFFNLRKPKFQDERVREALAYAFDFNWINKNLYYGMFSRSQSYFGPNEFAAAGAGLPSALEIELLEPYRGRIPERVFTEPVALPDTDGTQESLRQNLRVAAGLLRDAGYTMKDRQLVNAAGEPFTFEVIAANPNMNTVTLPWIENLKLLGIDAGIRIIDQTQLQGRLDSFDFEVVVSWIPQVGTPGAEQRNRWGSAAADQPGSYNWMGIRNPVVDELLEKVLETNTHEEYVAALRAVDRVLMWNFYFVPQLHGGGKINYGYWDRFGWPDIQPTYGQAVTSVWWVDPAKERALVAARGRVAPMGSALADEAPGGQ